MAGGGECLVYDGYCLSSSFTWKEGSLASKHLTAYRGLGQQMPSVPEVSGVYPMLLVNF